MLGKVFVIHTGIHFDAFVPASGTVPHPQGRSGSKRPDSSGCRSIYRMQSELIFPLGRQICWSSVLAPVTEVKLLGRDFLAGTGADFPHFNIINH